MVRSPRAVALAAVAVGAAWLAGVAGSSAAAAAQPPAPIHSLAPGTPSGTSSLRPVAMPPSGPSPIPGEGPDALQRAPAPHAGVAQSSPAAQVASSNWGGQIDYASTARFTSVRGDWTVPSVQPSASPRYAATWVGIGGVGTTALIQTGTTEETTGGTTSYFAWVELLPSAPVLIDAPVAPGDSMAARITEVAAGKWDVELDDLTQGWTAQRATVAYTAGTATSADWITERPEVSGSLATLADYGSTRFTHLAVAGTATISAGPVAYYMTGTTGIITYPSGIVATTTTSFTNTFGTPLPAVTSLSPSAGPLAGGSTVTISGSKFTDATAVHFGTASATYRVTSPTTITATSPAVSGTATVTVTVSVTTPQGTSAPSSASQFAYLTPAASSGYDLVGADGGVFVFDAPDETGGYYGSLPGLHVSPAKPIVGMVPTLTGGGYFLVGADGGVFAFGTAPYLGSLPGLHVTPAQPITGIVATDGDHGYFLVGRDGGVFAFGTAPYLGSLPGRGLSVDDIVGIAATPSGDGYWLVSATGTVYAFGAAQLLGTARGAPSPVSAIAGTPAGTGYWITTTAGAVYAQGSAAGHGTLPALGVTPTLPVVSIVPTAGTGGYWMLGADGGVFALGDAPYYGSLPGLGVHVTDIVGAVRN